MMRKMIATLQTRGVPGVCDSLAAELTLSSPLCDAAGFQIQRPSLFTEKRHWNARTPNNSHNKTNKQQERFQQQTCDQKAAQDEAHVCAQAQLHITRPPYNLINKMQKLLEEFGSGRRASSQAHQNLKDSWPKAPQNQVDQAATALATWWRTWFCTTAPTPSPAGNFPAR
jgi:hypothetical protein